MPHLKSFTIALSLAALWAFPAASVDLGLKPGFYSYTRHMGMMGTKDYPICSISSEPIEIGNGTLKLLPDDAGNTCRWSPITKDGDGFKTTISCPGGPSGYEVNYRLVPQSDTEFTLTYQKPYLPQETSIYRRCDYDFETARRKSAEETAEMGRKARERDAAFYKNAPQQQAAATLKCEAVKNIGAPEDFAKERIWVNPPGNSVFGSTMIQEFFGDILGPNYYGDEREKRKDEIEQRKKDAANRADSYSTRIIGDMVCAAAKKNIQISFEAGWFSSTPQRMIATSMVGKKSSISADLTATNDGPENARRWRLATLEVNGREVDLPQDSSGSVLLCLTSSSNAEKVLGFGTGILGALFEEELGSGPQDAGDKFGNSVLAMNDFCKPIRKHLGIAQ